MARLVVNPGSPTAWEIELKPGANTIGRGFANDFKIPDPSVSGSHCQITIDNSNAVLKDLGSTNGTFVNRAQISETLLQTGQTVHLGGVELLFQGDAPLRVPVPAPVRAPAASPPVLLPQPPAVAAPAIDAGHHTCKFHPKTTARYLCNQCQLAYCELCVTSRAVGGASHKYCRHCGAECVTLQVAAPRFAGAPSFYRRLPSAFAYPARGSGILALIVCALLFFGLDFLGNLLLGAFMVYFILGIFVKMLAYGYLFSFMQTIIHSTTAGDEEMPGLPPFEGLFGAFGRLAGAALISFGVAFGIYLVVVFGEASSMGSTFMVPALILGCIYFPMALLAVAMKDTPLAANPLIVVPAIAKTPKEYLLTVILLAAVMALQNLGGPLIHSVFPRGLTTHNMARMAAFLAASACWSIAEVYLLAVNMRILGLLYLAKKHKLGWFDH